MSLLDYIRSAEGKIWCGDALQVLRQLPRESVDAIVSSPPYYRQRDYGDDGQLGRERSPEQYVERLVEILVEAREVLKPSGSLWLVLGDKYVDGRLLGMPWRVALGAQARGWILRSDIIWHKPNAIPSPVKNRPTVDHEYIFFLTKSENYYYQADAIREPHVTFSSESKMRGGRKHFQAGERTPEAGKYSGYGSLHQGTWDRAFHPKGRNKRTVWSVPLSKSRDAHLAVFPEKLVGTILKAACPPKGVVLDPFLGSGTTALVASAMGHTAWGIDIQRDYCNLSQQRLKERGVCVEIEDQAR
jgi:DNA modification methylase